jgi:hypothetical protein
MHRILLPLQALLLTLNPSIIQAKSSIDQGKRSKGIFDWFNSFTSYDIPPISPSGAALFHYQNNSGIADDLVFIQVVGVDPNNGKQCFIQYDNEGNPSYFDVTASIDSSYFSYPVSYFNKNHENNQISFYLPKLLGARVYTSLHQKMTFQVIKNNRGAWTICAPNPLDPNDPNKNILWDKTEYTVDSNVVFINPTAVDDFCLPIHCQEVGTDGSSQSGGILVSRKEVFDDVNQEFLKAQGPWPLLISSSPSLIYSPIFAAAVGIFPKDYLVTSGWIDAFKKLFSTTDLIIDASESLPPNLRGGIWRGRINTKTNVITFNRDIDTKHPKIQPVQLTLPTNINELLSGSGPSWDIIAGDALQAVLARNLSVAIDTNTLSTTQALSKTYFESVSFSFYEENQSLPPELQFIDHYSKVLHSLANHQIYTIPYDDELNQSGAASYTLNTFAGGLITLNPVN